MKPGVYILSVFVFTLFVACQGGEEVTISPVRKTAICELSYPGDLNAMTSMEVVNDSLFAVSSMEDVLLFTRDGNYVRHVGRQGRARGEYVFPMKVRSDGSFIYVWSANTLSFLKYNIQGEYLDDYPYPSAISDFRVSGGNILVYTAGARSDHVIDIYDMSSKSVTFSVGEASEYHKLLCANISAAPMFCCGDTLYFCEKDKLSVSTYCGPTKIEESQLKSHSFHVDKSLTVPSITADRKSRQAYLARTSHTAGLMVLPSGEYRLIAYEGESTVEDKRLDNSGRLVTVYDSSGKTVYHKFEDVGSLASLSEHNGAFYFLDHTVAEGDDHYILYRLDT